jgi:hypothetical protein
MRAWMEAGSAGARFGVGVGDAVVAEGTADAESLGAGLCGGALLVGTEEAPPEATVEVVTEPAAFAPGVPLVEQAASAAPTTAADRAARQTRWAMGLAARRCALMP